MSKNPSGNADFGPKKPTTAPPPKPALVPQAVSGAPANAEAADPRSGLFRRVDWLTFAITAIFCLAGYLLTLSPDLTLEDCGELAVGSMYAGVPHPPGYPVWTLYTHLFTELIPFSNISFRVSVSSAVAASLSAGLLGLLVSRGSSMLLEGLDWFKNIERRLEQRICLISGLTSGLLLGFNGYIWSQAVIVEVYTLAVLTLMLLLTSLLRWIHKPNQLRHLYFAFFFFGLCLCNHQTLVVAAMGIEVAILAADHKLGRDFFVWNSVLYLVVVMGRATDTLGVLADNAGVFGIFNVIGLGSLLTVFWFNGKLSIETRRWALFILTMLVAALFANYEFAVSSESVLNAEASKIVSQGQMTAEMSSRLAAAAGWTKVSLQLLAYAAVGLFLGLWVVSYVTERADRLMSRWWPPLAAGLCFIAGAIFYFYMPLASATNPPMNWGYPRTWEGFKHAFSRGQYEKTNPSLDPSTFFRQVVMYAQGAKEEFNWANLLIGLVPFGFLPQMRRREKSWLIGLSAIYLCLAFLLLMLLNPGLDRQGRSLVKVFFTSSHVIIALTVGYGLSLIAGMIVTRYKETRIWLLIGSVIALGLNIYEMVSTFHETQLVSARVGAAISVGIAMVFLALVALREDRLSLGPVLAAFALIPADSMFSHWADNEQHGHLFGFWFGHDMFTPPFKGKDGKPLYPEMARDAVLYGGTDPGRFCPTYMIFCESFIPPDCRRDPEFDRRDVCLITQNALADNTYLDYIRAHYNRSAEVDLPFFQGMLNDQGSIERGRTNALARLAAPLDRWITDNGARIEKRRRAGSSFFKATDFLDLRSFQSRLQSAQDPLSAYLKGQLGAAVSGDAEALARALNHLIDNGASLFDDAARFTGVTLPERLLSFARQNPATPNRIRLNRLLLEAAYPKWIATSPGGLYPDREIRIATNEEGYQCLSDYTADAANRYRLGQLEPGEVVAPMPDGRVQVLGQFAVMNINGLISKVMFDKNPDHEFYVEESFPLKWMYPHLTPFGIIMKVERNPLTDLSDDQIKRDHEFWSQYTSRLIGNWITYDTPSSEICDFALRTYHNYDLKNFKGDPKFVRDDVAQKSFSKLRNAIGKSIWIWRAQTSQNPTQQAKYLREAEFALKQAFAFCPFSPESVFNLSQVLASTGRVDDAIRVVETALVLDPDNGGVEQLGEQLRAVKSGAKSAPPVTRGQTGPNGATGTVTRALETAAMLIQSGRTNQAAAVLDAAMAVSSDYNTLMQYAQGYQLLGRLDRVEAVIEKMTKVAPNNAEGWLNLALVQASLGRTAIAQSNLDHCFQVSDAEKARDPRATDFRQMFKNEARFAAVRQVLH